MLYCKQEKKMKHLHFVQQIIQHLGSSSTKNGDVSRPVKPERFGLKSSNLLRLKFSATRHWLKPIPATEQNPKARRERVVCKSHRNSRKFRRVGAGKQ